MSLNNLYNAYSEYLKNKYGQKVYKLPINIPVTCPNRIDGGCGCIYCGDVGAGFENLPGTFSVKEQLIKNREYIGKRYKAEKFIAYFQNFTNTYLPLETFKEYMWQAAEQDVCEIAVSTRPDCIRAEYLDILKEIKEKTGINITIELGLQSVNSHTLKKINRGHTLAEFIESVILIKSYGFEICTHIILNLPWDDIDDFIEGAKIISALRIDSVKLHALYIVKNTKMAQMYENGDFTICSNEEYKNRVISFLEYLSPDITIQRLLGRAPEEETIFSNWGTSWWKLKEEIEAEMENLNTYQGKNYNYLGGKAVKKFFTE